MALTPRQVRAYQDVVNLYRPGVPTKDPVTKLNTPNSTYTLAYSNVKALLGFTQNVSDPIEGLGGAKRPGQFTYDLIHMDAAQECGENWIIQYANANALKNQLWITEGEPQIVPSRGGRNCNYKGFELSSVEEAPAGVTALP